MRAFAAVVLLRAAKKTSRRAASWRPWQVSIVVLIAILGARAASGEEWLRFRGPNGAGVDRQTHIPAQWTPDSFAWKAELPGVGHSSPVLWGPKLFLTSGDEETGERFVFCFNADTGEELWRRRIPAPTTRKHKLNTLASSTPAVDSGHTYVTWATTEAFVALALDHNGEEVWRTSLGSFRSGHGFGVSPIVYEDLLIVANEHEGDSFLAALDTANGNVVWKLDRETKVTYSTPCVYRGGDGQAAIVFTNWSQGFTAHEPRTGKLLWQKRVFGTDHVETAIGSPIVAGDLIIGVSGWLAVTEHAVAVRPTGSADKKSAVEEVYHITRGAPLSTTPLAVGELLFLWSDDGVVTCCDSRTGEVHYRRRAGGTYYGSPVCAGDNVFCMSADGEVVVIPASPEFQLLGRNPLGEPGNSTPAIARGKMFVRTRSKLFAVQGQ